MLQHAEPAVENSAEAGHAASGTFDAGATILGHVADSPSDHPLIHLPTIAGIDMSVTKHVLMLWVAAAFLLIVVTAAVRRYVRAGDMVPKGPVMGLIEYVAVRIRDEIVAPNVGKKWVNTYTPLIMMFFLFIVTINALVQLLVPPPKYHVTSLLDCDLVNESPLDGVLLMERGKPVIEDVALEPALDELLANTEDAYTFPPFGWFAPYLTFDGMNVEALRTRERELLRSAVARGWRSRLRVAGHEWAEVIPTLLDGRTTARQPSTQPAAAISPPTRRNALGTSCRAARARRS